MDFLVTLLHKDNIYHYKMSKQVQVTFGSHKKDTVYVPDLVPGQIMLRPKNGGLLLNVKSPFQAPEDNKHLLDRIIVLNQETRTALFICNSEGMGKKTLKLPYQSVVRVGRETDNTISVAKPYVSGHHCVIRSEHGVIHIEDLQSTNGVFVNGKRVKKSKLNSGDVVSIMNLRIHIKDGILYFEDFGDALTLNELAENHVFDELGQSSEQECELKYQRSPRMQEKLPSEDIVLAAAPMKGQKFEKSRGMFASLIGSGAMVASGIAMGAMSPALLAARAATLAMPVASIASQKSGNKRRKKRLDEYALLRQKKYFNYISEQKARIDAVAEQQRLIITRENPSPQDCIKIMKNLERRLWERRETDQDFLHIRLGMGYEDLCIHVQSHNINGAVQVEADEVQEMSEQLIEETSIVDNIPSRISLFDNTSVGIIGKRKRVIALVRNMIIALTTAHCYQEVKVVGLFDEEEHYIWDSMRWLPHIWDEEKQFRYLAFTKEQTHNVCEMFNDILCLRESEGTRHSFSEKIIPMPYYIFIFGSKKQVEKEEIMNHLFRHTSAIGMSSLFLFDDIYSLPHDCQYIIDLVDEPCMYPINQANNKIFFTPDKAVSDQDFDDFARQLSAIELDGFAVKNPIPNSVTFLQGYGVEKAEELNILERWNASNPAESLKAPIGILDGGKIFSLDIHEKAHGPHGLVAGTTGSGKSELLQSWILSMAVNYHPYDVVFVIIDYKGGGMANLLEPLPHVVGKITNIGNNITRSLVSLRSEIKRRLVIFDKSGVNHIDKYQKLYQAGRVKEPLPHLIIVADEFAELKKEEPDFMTGLIETARVGRSLGIHLVLATQKPSGVVDDQIWSNSRFKLCLKVADVGDSREMLKKTDAAYITQAGRAYVQIGMDEVYELFQSFWSTAPYLENENERKKGDNQVKLVDMSGFRIKTIQEEYTRHQSDIDELTVIVKLIGKVAQQAQIVPLAGPWLPELPEEISLYGDIIGKHGFDGAHWQEVSEWLKVPIGLYDAPALQSQGVQYMDFVQDGHYGIYGAPSTGKTTLLKTVISSMVTMYSPDDVNFYILDCGGWGMNVFAGFPHVGGVVLDTEEEKLEKFERMILEEIERRKQLFLEKSVSSLSVYRRMVSEKLPALIIAIDNFAALFEMYPDMEQFLVRLAREGAAYGIYMIFTANSTSGVRFKVLQNIRGAVAFELADRGDYAGIVGRLDGISIPNMVGRAIFKGNPPIEFQTAIYAEGNDDNERTEWLRHLAAVMTEKWTGKLPAPIPVMPQRVTLSMMERENVPENVVPVGIKYEDISLAKLDLSKQYCMVVTGEMDKVEKMLCRIATLFLHRESVNKIYVIDGTKNGMKNISPMIENYTVAKDVEAVHAMLEEIVTILNQRKKIQNQLHTEESSDAAEEAFEQICIFIGDIKEFVDVSTDEDCATMERICRLAGGLSVLVFAGGSGTDISKYNAIESLTQAIVSCQKGLAVSGSSGEYSFFKNSMKYSKRSEEAGEGNGYLFDDGCCCKIKWME